MTITLTAAKILSAGLTSDIRAVKLWFTNEIPTTPPPPSSSQTPTQQSPDTVFNIQTSYSQKRENDIKAMKIILFAIQTIQSYKLYKMRGSCINHHRYTRSNQAYQRMHLAKFHKMTDAKEMWDAIKSRFGGNDKSKKMQKYILKQLFKGFSVSNSEAT
ncbi:hypothetical protein Tco_0410704 [Tanacetum coccineum]